MNNAQKLFLFLLRVSLGWLFFYAGITKILDPKWSAEGYIKGAKMFPDIYTYFLKPGILPLVNLINEWGLLLIGIALIIGIFVRWAAIGGVILMALYYFVILDFPYPNEHSYIVDEHVIYALALMVLAVFGAGKAWGLGHRFS